MGHVEVSNVYGFTFCDGEIGVDSKTMFGEYIVSNDEQEKEIGSFDGIGDQDVDDEDIDVETEKKAQFQDFHPKMDGHHVLIGTIIAASILFCGFLTMAYVAYIYLQHRKQQNEMSDRAQRLLEEAQEERNQRQFDDEEEDNVQLQSALTHANYNYQSITTNNIQEEDAANEEEIAMGMDER